MEVIKMIIPTQEQIDSAKERGVDLLFELTLLVKSAIKNHCNGIDTKMVSIEKFDPKQYEQLSEYGIDISEHSAHAYINEVQHQLNQEMVKNPIKVIDIGEGDKKDVLLKMIEVFDNENESTVVVSTSLGTAILDAPGFVSSPVCGGIINSIYLIGKYKNVEVKIDPFMKWIDHRIIFVK